MSIPQVSRDNFVPAADIQVECQSKYKAIDFSVSTMVGHFFLSCAAMSGVAFAVTAAPAALASFVVCLVCASTCYFPDEIGRTAYIFPRHYTRPHIVPVPVPQPRPVYVPVVGQPQVVVDPHLRHQVGGSHAGPRNVVGGNHM